MIGLWAFAAAATAACPIEDARYALRGLPEVTAYFQPVDSGSEWPSQLALAIHSDRTGKTTWWLPWQGGSDNRTNIASTVDVTSRSWHPPNPDGGPRPLGDRQWLTTDADYNILPAVPERGRKAPAHMIDPDAGGSGDDVYPVKQFFDLVGCAAKAR